MESAPTPSFVELTSFISSTFATLRTPYMEWSNLARQAIQGLPYNGQKLAELEQFINRQRAALRKAILLASEHYEDAQLAQLRDEAGMSKCAWKSLKKSKNITLRNGFTLLSY